MLSLDEEDYELLGWGGSQFAIASDALNPLVKHFQEWREAFAKTPEGKAAIKRKKRRQNKAPRKVLQASARSKKWRSKPEVKARRLVYMRKYMCEYRASKAGKVADAAAKKKYRMSSKGKAMRSRENKRQYAKRKAAK